MIHKKSQQVSAHSNLLTLITLIFKIADQLPISLRNLMRTRRISSSV
jgi:hypothetical protein